ncbi:porphobilinogen deaminase [Galbibacter marinus]|uniref:Hydroxymethylbilane synthase n=1 Tax=Galbibacter marinus TaxID=555500 RepID=K2P6M9_9FLAO|nr:hydroxymethylbilane synthase [Galbibacter marinus]EKF56668.1 porphobilinogen deaminase [Galbibacter marinus]
MRKTIKIGTRDSELALWQANRVKSLLEADGYQTEIVAVKSQGDLLLDKPIHQLGITGVFTKTLDIAMLNGTVDIVVHSMKDVPTELPDGIVKGAVLKRANPKDLLIQKEKSKLLPKKATIATGSLRRKAQWLNKYPEHKVANIRGNVQTRLQKLEDSPWNGAIFAAAGLERINLRPETTIELDWMIPAPAQGAMLVVALEHDDYSRKALEGLNDYQTDICTTVERDFLRTLEGGCSAPIGALATIDIDYLTLVAGLFSIDGKQKVTIEKKVLIENCDGLGHLSALEVLKQGGEEIMKVIRKDLKL